MSDTGHDQAVANASAAFAATAVARLARNLHESGVIDDLLLGELAAAAQESGRDAGGDAARQAMEVVRAQLGLPSRSELNRQASLDAAEDAEDAAERS